MEKQKTVKCDPWKHPFESPLYIFLILSLINFIIFHILVSRQRNRDTRGRSAGTIKTAAYLFHFLYSLLSFILLAYTIYVLSKNCNFVLAWMIFFVSLLLPIINFLILTYILRPLLVSVSDIFD